MRHARYRTTLDRVGWSLATGIAACGIAAAFLGWSDGATWQGVIGIALTSAMLAAAAIVGLAAPIWWRLRRRGPIAAGVTGATLAALLAFGVMTRGFGLGLPQSDGAIWISALAMAAVAAFLGGLLALAMWLVAYRER